MIHRFIAIQAICFSFFIVASMSVGICTADIITDGTLGAASHLNGPDYQIDGSLGRQSGTNLYHSFSVFDIHAGETATFLGSSMISNILCRVTGHDASYINGTIRSTIKGADLYFLNPNGVIFDTNAALDIDGSFHVATADYIRMQDNQRFDTAAHAGEVLSSAPPFAFGFVENTNATITVKAKTYVEDSAGDTCTLRLDNEKVLSLVAGNILLENGAYTIRQNDKDDSQGTSGDYDVHGIKNLTDLAVPDGTINLAAVRGKGEIALTRDAPDISGFDGFGDINVNGSFKADVSGQGGGNIFIRAGRFFSSGSDFVSETMGDQDGGQIDIQAESLSFKSGRISTSTMGSGAAGHIHITAQHIEITGNTVVSSASHASDNGGNAGDIVFSAGSELQLKDNTTFSTQAVSGGGGKITVTAENLVKLHNSRLITRIRYGTGNGGDILIDPDLVILNNGHIIADAHEGNGGNIHILAGCLIKSGDSRISASSELGIDGNIIIDSPESDISRDINQLPTDFMDVSRWEKNPCAVRPGKTISRFIISGPPVISDFFQNERYMPFFEAPVKNAGDNPDGDLSTVLNGLLLDFDNEVLFPDMSERHLKCTDCIESR